MNIAATAELAVSPWVQKADRLAHWPDAGGLPADGAVAQQARRTLATTRSVLLSLAAGEMAI